MKILTPLRVLLLLAGFLVMTGFDTCNDDPILDSGGSQGCSGSHCSARVLTDSLPNPTRF